MQKLPHNFVELLCDTSDNKEATKLWNMMKNTEYQEEATKRLNGNTEIMKHWPQNGKFTPIHRCAGDDVYCLLLWTFLTVLKMDPHRVDHDGDTALNRAASKGQLNSMTLLLEAGAKTNATNKLGNTALHRAAMSGMQEAAICLLRKGANSETENHAGYTPLICATRHGHVQVVQTLLSNSNGHQHIGALHHAISIQNNNIPGAATNTVFGLLLNKSTLCDLDEPSYNGMSVSARVHVLDIQKFRDAVEKRKAELLTSKLDLTMSCDKSCHSTHSTKKTVNNEPKPAKKVDWPMEHNYPGPALFTNNSRRKEQDTHSVAAREFNSKATEFQIQPPTLSFSCPQFSTDTQHINLQDHFIVFKDIVNLSLHLDIGLNSTNEIIVYLCDNVQIVQHQEVT